MQSDEPVSSATTGFKDVLRSPSTGQCEQCPAALLQSRIVSPVVFRRDFVIVDAIERHEIPQVLLADAQSFLSNPTGLDGYDSSITPLAAFHFGNRSFKFRVCPAHPFCAKQPRKLFLALG